MRSKYILSLITLICFIKLNTATIECSLPKCDYPDCDIDYNTKPCPSCICPEISKY